jgi:transcriptional regulator with XRE-family HTH domain
MVGASNISQSMISHYMTGRALPGYTILKKIANALDCSVDDLYLKF